MNSKDLASFISYINELEGIKLKCKEIHWTASNLNLHRILDDITYLVAGFEDDIVEEVQGIIGNIEVSKIKPTNSFPTPECLIKHLLDATLDYYEVLPTGLEFVGLKSEFESFIFKVYKYKYLLSMCES